MLSDLLAGALADAEQRRATYPLAAVEAAAAERAPALDALSFLAPAERVRIIAEVKRASPSRGQLA
ncbi:MAG TPA: indole-3-glycerol-phosphate synthase TrpC, partial [Cryobacterium sp.]|nr:indole-3-glycerol-phosphate synthase TrpC [Cryobacterium sp.]